MNPPTLEQVAEWLALATDDEIHHVLELAWPDQPDHDTKDTHA
ncbi:hypothetical protein OED52_04230 [Rhodococcus sp. Z13]|uniref:Uncharacterized protein n=1 Tax=Rhodococcus sacchari TaxID=2962047 RepID=A0ACD4DIA5_9NOCA|nr:hypothetical protein [Rhodococcus sp. Z13]UYP19772.1 hypothetical protein OED52_04230 [Rhodococcus sp. Z13]